MLEDTNSLDGAPLILTKYSVYKYMGEMDVVQGYSLKQKPFERKCLNEILCVNQMVTQENIKLGQYAPLCSKNRRIIALVWLENITKLQRQKTKSD